MKSKIWPQRPWKWPLDLNDLGRGPLNFFKNYIFEISAFQRKRWAMSRLRGQNFLLNLSTEEVCKGFQPQWVFPVYGLEFKFYRSKSVVHRISKSGEIQFLNMDTLWKLNRLELTLNPDKGFLSRWVFLVYYYVRT